MREIKFRGRDLDGKWQYGQLFIYPDGGVHIIDMDGYDDLEDETVIQVDKDTVGQFTGLLDNNGKEIFEGDIIEENRGYCVKDGIRTDFIFHSVVFWYKSGFMHKGPGIFSDSFDNVKIIGNVHDNPDLLEVEHDRRN